VNAKTGFRVPVGVEGLQLKNIFCVFLNGKGGINHVLNTEGGRTSKGCQGRPNYYC
jgi:hypothetical protein